MFRIETLEADVSKNAAVTNTNIESSRVKLSGVERVVHDTNQTLNDLTPTPGPSAPVAQFTQEIRKPLKSVNLRSKYDFDYDEDNDPIVSPRLNRNAPVHIKPSLAHQNFVPQPSFAAQPAGGTFETTNIIRTAKLPDTKEYPTFNGRAGGTDDVAIRLLRFHTKIDPMKESRHLTDENIIERMYAIFEDDAADFYSSTHQANNGESKSLLWWNQAFLDHYVTSEANLALLAARARYRFPSSEKDPYLWSAKYLAMCLTLDTTLSVRTYVNKLMENVPHNISSIIQEKMMEKRITSLDSANAIFSSIISSENSRINSTRKALRDETANEKGRFSSTRAEVRPRREETNRFSKFSTCCQTTVSTNTFGG